MIAIQGGEIKTITRGSIYNGVVVIENDKVKEIMDSGDLPEGTEIIDAREKVITPGLIDVHTHLGLVEEGSYLEDASINEMTEPVTSHLRALDAVNPYDKGFQDALKGGVTCVQILPGSSNVIGGQGVILKTSGRVVDEMVVQNPSGLKVAFGENPKKVYKELKKLPSTRMGTAACLRQSFLDAQNYVSKYKSKKEEGFFEKDLKMEVLKDVLEGKMPVRMHAHRADDIMTAVRIAEEFGFNYTLEHCTEGDKIKDHLFAKNVKAALGPTLSSRSKLELKDLGWHTIIALNNAGVETSITTDHPALPIGYLSLCAALAAREGLEEDEALKAVTYTAAKHLELEERIGSIEPGRDADLVVWSDDPFYFKSQVEIVFIGGRKVYERSGQ